MRNNLILSKKKICRLIKSQSPKKKKWQNYTQQSRSKRKLYLTMRFFSTAIKKILVTLFNIKLYTSHRSITAEMHLYQLFPRNDSLASAYMTLLPETLYSTRIYTAEKVMEPPVEIRIAIVALSSPTDLPRIVCAEETLVRRRRNLRNHDSF